MVWSHLAAQHYSFVILPVAAQSPYLLDCFASAASSNNMSHHPACAGQFPLDHRRGDFNASAEATRLVQVVRPSQTLSPRHRLVRCRATVGLSATPFTRGQRVLFRITAMTTLLVLGGCAGLGQEFMSFQRGWRTGEIVAVGRADQIEERGYSDCRRDADAAELKSSQYAALTYRLGQRQHWHIVKVSPDAVVFPGDRVAANVESCHLPIYRLPPPPSSN